MDGRKNYTGPRVEVSDAVLVASKNAPEHYETVEELGVGDGRGRVRRVLKNGKGV